MIFISCSNYFVFLIIYIIESICIKFLWIFKIMLTNLKKYLTVLIMITVLLKLEDDNAHL